MAQSDECDEWDASFMEATSGAASDVEVLPPADGDSLSLRKAKAKGGRPRGDFGSQFLRNVMRAMDTPAENPEPGTIEHARHVKAQKRATAKAKALEQMRVDVAQGHAIDSARKGSEQLKEVGPLSVMNQVTDKLQQTLLQAAVACHEQNIPLDDALVSQQLHQSMSNISVRALQHQLGEGNVGARVLNIATACLEFCCCFWTVFLVTLQQFLGFQFWSF